ncbi:unnamed protein product [Mytilus edulis]|uniref:Uncharacterized protein n=1 Tax=Mytilus edulis TaxID=6550 RepID=A0A8S3TGE8_MYTED|nr:unnamed protein product [Mytilus edulis]
MVIKNSLHVSCWNINGFKLKGYNKYSDSDFISEFNKKDIFCLLETHCSLEDALEIPDFKAVHLIRPMSARTRKRSGGISVYVSAQKDVYSIPNQYIWEENSAEKFQNALASPLVQEKIKTFNNTNYTGDSNIMIQDLNNILYEAANISIKKKIIKKVNSTAKVKKSQQSKWFDLPLINMKKQLCDKEKLFKKYNKDPYIRSSFFALLKKYRKARKTKYREFRADLIDQLDNLREENPKSYWTLLESLKNSDKKTEKSSNITSTEWAEYFKDLNKKPVTPSPNIIEFLRNLENAKVFTELDILITDKEISDAIHTLKNKKSCGPDSISNEMIKNSQSFLIKSLNHVFNKYFQLETILRYGLMVL